MSNDDNNINQNNKNIELYQSDAIKNSRLINYGFYNIDTKLITISYNHTINSEIKFTADKKKWTNNHKLLFDELDQYGVSDNETRLLSKKFLNDNESKILTDYSSSSNVSGENNEDPESEQEEQKRIKEITIYKYSESGKGQLHEAILIDKLPYFAKYDPISQTAECVENIPEIYRILRPPTEEEYPYRPYKFESYEELSFYIQKAKQITKDELYKITKNIFTMFVDQDKHVIVLLAADSISNSITQIINKNFTLSFMIMSELFTNKAMEDDMTKKFLCILYFQDRNERQVIENGLNPNTIWEEMGYKSFETSLIPQIIVKLINNNLQNHYITFDSITGNVKLTDRGRAYGSQNCY
jgi:hypothetical protein